MLTAAATGFATGLSLILAIGAQNAFVLQQGLRREHVLWVCLICALSDAVLIIIGVVGIGSIGAAFPDALRLLTLAGAVFLIVYGAMSMRRALNPGALHASAQQDGSLRRAVMTALAVTWLNPHAYLDTVGLIGAVSTGFDGFEAKAAFALGAISAEFLFFFSLGYGARMLAPIFARPRAWAVFDIVIALVMWSIAALLIAEL